MKIGNVDLTRHIMIVAEIGGNHNGDFEAAKTMVKEAAASGVDAVKFQTYQSEYLVSRDLPSPAHVKGVHSTLYERLKSLEFSRQQWRTLKELCDQNGILFLSTPFDAECVDFLEPFVPAFKVASGDLDNIPLLRHIASKNKPVILSCGMATPSEIEQAIRHLPLHNTVLLHCVSKYPTPFEEANLNRINVLRDRFGCLVGYSDHTIGITACAAAAAMGAAILEKHFTLDKDQPIGDHKLSADPDDLRSLVQRVRTIQTLMGNDTTNLEADHENKKWLRRSLHAKCDIEAGTVLNNDMLVAIRPADGISPSETEFVIGKRAKARIPCGVPITYDKLKL